MLQTVTVDLKWYCFRQNNSGGSFIVNDSLGHYLFVQERSAEAANQYAERVCDDSDYCPCCGPRWDIDVSTEDGYDEPHVYNTPLVSYKPDWTEKVSKLHYFDGHIETFIIPERE